VLAGGALLLALSFASLRASLILALGAAAFALVLKAGLLGVRRAATAARPLAPALAPLAWLALLLFGAMAFRGPQHLWFILWGPGMSRVVILALGASLLLWTVAALLLAGGMARRDQAVLEVGGAALMATSVSLLAVAALVPDAAMLLAALDRPLGLLPMTHAIVIGILTYGRVGAISAWYLPLLTVLLIGGAALTYGSRYRRAFQILRR
jgi:hypothetical protein